MRHGSDEVRGGGFALHCIGDVRLYRGGVDCTPKSRKGRALLAVLAAEQRPLTRVRIIDLLWSDRQEEQARASLRTLLADLRDQFGGDFDKLLAVDRERVALCPSVRTDLSDPALARPAGELFEGLDHIDPELDDWLRTEREKWGHSAHSPSFAIPTADPGTPPGSFKVRIPSLLAAIVVMAAPIALLLVTTSSSSKSTQVEIDAARRSLLGGSPAAAEDARRRLIGVVQAEPNNAQALAMLAEATMAASDHPGIGGRLPLATARREARAYSSRAIKLSPTDAYGWAALGISYFATAAGVKPLEKAVELDPNDSKYRWQLARALEYENRYDEGYLHSRRAIALDPKAAEPRIGFIRVAMQLNRSDEIKAQVAAYARHNPAPGDLAYVHGYFAYAEGDYPRCVKLLEPLVISGNYRPLNPLNLCLTALGEKRRAAEISSRRPSFVADVLREDADAVVRRAKAMGREFWLRNFESLAASDLLVRAGKSRELIQLFDASYDSVEEFEREGGRVALEPLSILYAMQIAGREEARSLRDLLVKQGRDQRDGMGLDTWSLFTKAAVALADGDRDWSVSILEQCFPDCFVGYLTLDISETAFFGRLNGHPGFDRLVARNRQRVNGLRKQAGLPPLPV